MYRLIRPLLFWGDPETMHGVVCALGKFAVQSPARRLLESAYAFDDPRLRTRVFGIDFPNPVGLAAGFDKNAELVNLAACLGFGFTEVGTVTPLAQDGNPRPRLFRLTRDEAIVNRMGFNGKGAVEVQERLARVQRKQMVLGVNISKNKATPNELAVEDYLMDFRILADSADYVTVNVSSPNTPELRALQRAEPLRELLQALQKENRRRERQVPLLVKISPNLNFPEVDAMLEVAAETKITGVIATNTSVSRVGLVSSTIEVARAGEGGLSGAPLKSRSTDIIRYIYKQTSGKLPIIGVGGIASAEDAYEKILAGASLVQVYTGLIYEGPGLVIRVKQGLVKLLERDGFSSVAEAVGKGA